MEGRYKVGTNERKKKRGSKGRKVEGKEGRGRNEKEMGRKEESGRKKKEDEDEGG